MTELQQFAEYGRVGADGVFTTDSGVDGSTVDSANRDRIIAREKNRGGHWEGDWYVFPSHPDLPEAAEYRTRIRWSGTEQYRQPRNRTQAEAALNVRQGMSIDRRVDWHYFKPRHQRTNDNFDINVKPGNMLHLTVWSGLPFLHVRSGHVTVDFRSRWGNSITIHEGASAHVVVKDPDTKVGIHDEGGILTMDIPQGKNRVFYPRKYFDITAAL